MTSITFLPPLPWQVSQLDFHFPLPPHTTHALSVQAGASLGAVGMNLISVALWEIAWRRLGGFGAGPLVHPRREMLAANAALSVIFMLNTSPGFRPLSNEVH